MPALTVAQIAEICGASFEGDSHRLIAGANNLESATPRDLSFVSNRKTMHAAGASRAGCLLVPESFDRRGPWAIIRLPDPRAAFTQVLGALYPKRKPVPSIHSTAVIARSAKMGEDCFVGAYATIGEETMIGAGCCIGNGCAIGDRVRIGENTTLHANVTIYGESRVGARVVVHSGSVIGADGFGFSRTGDRYEKFPQVGTVEIEDDVEIGANCCIDRAALGVTRIGEGTKLDNLVHIAHNCSVGRHVVIAAQTGFSGSAVVGDYAVIGGQVGVGEKANIEPGAIVGGKAGVLTSQTVRAGEPVWGIPARPLRQHLKGLAHIAKLPELRKQFAELKSKLTALESKSNFAE